MKLKYSAEADIIEFPAQKIKILGIFGKGLNLLYEMYEYYKKDENRLAMKSKIITEFIVVDREIRENNPVPKNLILATDFYKPEIIKENKEKIRETISDADLLIIFSKMGDYSATYDTVLIANLAKKMGILTLIIATTPFIQEGADVMENAEIGIASLEEDNNFIIQIDNNYLKKTFGRFSQIPYAYEILNKTILNIIKMFSVEGYVGIDLEDLRYLMSLKGEAVFGWATQSGENRAEKIFENIKILGNYNITEAKGLLCNIIANHNNFTNKELELIAKSLKEKFNSNIDIKYNVINDPNLKDNLEISFLAFGIEEKRKVIFIKDN